MVFVHYLLGCNAFFHRPNRDGNPMLITPANKPDISFLGSLVAAVNVGRKVTSCEVTDMHRSICIWKSSCNKKPVVIHGAKIGRKGTKGQRSRGPKGKGPKRKGPKVQRK